MTNVYRVQEVKTYNVCLTWENVDFLVTYDPLFDGTFFDDSTWTITLIDESVYDSGCIILSEEDRQEITSAVRNHLSNMGVINQFATA